MTRLDSCKTNPAAKTQSKNELNDLVKKLIRSELERLSETKAAQTPRSADRNSVQGSHRTEPKSAGTHKRTRSDQSSGKPLGSGSRLTSRRGSNTGERPVAILDMVEAAEEKAPELGGGLVKLNDEISQGRDKLIQYNVAYARKHHDIPPTTLDYYKFVKLIGKGAFGKVTLGIHKLTGKYVAIKAIEKSHMQDDFSRRKVFREVYILKKIRHANVIRLLEVFESSKHLLIVMEYAGGGDLLQYIRKKKRLDESEARGLFRQIVYGLGHIHAHSVLHRDIKLDNMLLDTEHGVKICDFGVSKILDRSLVIKEQCGTPAYIAPEIISDTGYKGFYSDHWSLGVLLYSMLCGTVPFKAANMEELHKLIKAGKVSYPVTMSEGTED